MPGARVALLYVNSDPSSGPVLLVAHAWPLGTPDPAHVAAVVVDLHYPHDANCGHLVAQAQNELTTASSLINQFLGSPPAAHVLSQLPLHERVLIQDPYAYNDNASAVTLAVHTLIGRVAVLSSASPAATAQPQVPPTSTPPPPPRRASTTPPPPPTPPLPPPSAARSASTPSPQAPKDDRATAHPTPPERKKEGLTVVIVDGKGNVLSTAKQHESVHRALAEARVKSGYAPPMEVDQHPLPPLPPPPARARSGGSLGHSSGSGYQHGEGGELAPLITPSSTDVAHTSTKQVVYQGGAIQVVIDAANVGMHDSVKQVEAGVSARIRAVRVESAIQWFLERGVGVAAFLPQYVVFRPDGALMPTEDQSLLEDLVRRGLLATVPSKDADDLYVIHYAWSKNAHVVSNDHFRDWMTRLKELSPEMPQWLKSKRVSYTFFQDEFMPNPAHPFIRSILQKQHRGSPSPPVESADGSGHEAAGGHAGSPPSAPPPGVQGAHHYIAPTAGPAPAVSLGYQSTHHHFSVPQTQAVPGAIADHGHMHTHSHVPEDDAMMCVEDMHDL